MIKHSSIIILGLFTFFCGCKEDPTIHANRLKTEASRIHNSTLQAILKNDLKFQIDLDEQEQFFASLRNDLERCRVIEAELRAISPGADVTKLEENTKGILLAITKREEQNQRYQEATPKVDSTMDHKSMIEGLQRTIATYKEVGKDTAEVEQLLSQLQSQEVEQGGTGQPATRFQSKSEGDDKPQPEAEWRPR